MNREELAWAAGLFDGEGSTFISFQPYQSKRDGFKKYPVIRMDVAQSGEFALPLLERFKKAVGDIGVIYGPINYKSLKYKHYQAAYKWQIASLETCQSVYAQLWRFLSDYKKLQITTTSKYIIEYKKRSK